MGLYSALCPAKTSRLFALLAVLLFGVAGLRAQTNFGTIRGEVKDAQGAIIPHSEVTLTNEVTKISRTDFTNPAGIYTFSSVDPGTYKVTIKMPNFRTFEEAGNVVTLGATTTVDASLAVGATGEVVEVTADSLVLDTASASGGQLYTAQQVEDLPLLGRNPFMLEAFDTNVVLLGDPRYVRAEDQTGSSQVSLAGAPSNSNSYVVDGIPISTSSGGVTFIPALESVESARIQANAYDAEVGRSGGGVFNSTLKTGGAQYHGVLYGETRQTPWSSNIWFNFNGAPTPSDTTYIYEGAFGGPLPFSKKYKFLNDTFFWVDEAGYRQGQPLTGVTTQFYVPTVAERAGNFSADTNYPLYDPTKRSAGGADTCRLSLLGDCGGATGLGSATDPLNVVPTSYVNSIGSYIANQFPTPSNGITYGGGTNFNGNGTSFKSRDDTYSGKLAHTFAPWYTATASYVHSAIQEPSGNALGVVFANSTKLLRYTDATAINNTFTVTPTTLLTLSYGYNRYYSAAFQYSTGFNAASGFGGAGFSQGFASQLQSPTFPAITLTGVGSTASIGASNGGPTVYASHNVVAVLSKTINRHNLNVGYTFRAFDVYTNPTTGGAGAFTFNGEYSNAAGTSNSNSPGAIADLIMGLPSAATVTLNSGVFINTEGYQAVFAQDDFRLNQKLTLNYGLRYEYEAGQSEQSNRYNVGFNPKAASSYTGAAGNAVSVTGGIQFAGQGGAPVACCDNSKTKFSPRVGFSYAPNSTMVIHGGYGVFFAPVGIAAATTGYSQTSTYSPGNATGPVATGNTAYLTSPFASGLLRPTGNSLGPLTGIGSSFTGSSTYAFTTGLQDFGKRYPFVEQYSFNIEQEFPRDSTCAHRLFRRPRPQLRELHQHQPDSRRDARNLRARWRQRWRKPFHQGGESVLRHHHRRSSRHGSRGHFDRRARTASVALSAVRLHLRAAVQRLLQLQRPRRQSREAHDARPHRAHHLHLVRELGQHLEHRFAGLLHLSVRRTPTTPRVNTRARSTAFPTASPRPSPTIFPSARGQRFLGGHGRIVDALVGGWEVNDEWIVQNGVPVSIVQTDVSSGTYGTTGVGGTYQRPNLAAISTPRV